jgi:hypothetical protein
MQELLTSELVIADLTGGNPNVYYELAARHCIGKPVVQILQKGEKLPFDVHDVNTIAIDHNDLDSVDEAKERLKRLLKSFEATVLHENPITLALQALGIVVREAAVNTKTLFEQFEMLSEQIKEELTLSKTERRALWRELNQNRRNDSHLTRTNSVNENDLSGLWDSNNGPVRLIQDGEDILGSYKYGDIEGWVGSVYGRRIGGRVIFCWRWMDLKPLSGLGFWDITKRGLRGYWYYDRELLLGWRDYQRKPNYLVDHRLVVNTDEPRNWDLTRKVE